MEKSEEVLVAGLLDAQSKARVLFAEVENRHLICRGAKESAINEGIVRAGREHVRNLQLLA